MKNFYFPEIKPGWQGWAICFIFFCNSSWKDNFESHTDLWDIWSEWWEGNDLFGTKRQRQNICFLFNSSWKDNFAKPCKVSPPLGQSQIWILIILSKSRRSLYNVLYNVKYYKTQKSYRVYKTKNQNAINRQLKLNIDKNLCTYPNS